jgi:hypothetical protein
MTSGASRVLYSPTAIAPWSTSGAPILDRRAGRPAPRRPPCRPPMPRRPAAAAPSSRWGRSRAATTRRGHRRHRRRACRARPARSHEHVTEETRPRPRREHRPSGRPGRDRAVTSSSRSGRKPNRVSAPEQRGLEHHRRQQQQRHDERAGDHVAAGPPGRPRRGRRDAPSPHAERLRLIRRLEVGLTVGRLASSPSSGLVVVRRRRRTRPVGLRLEQGRHGRSPELEPLAALEGWDVSIPVLKTTARGGTG